MSLVSSFAHDSFKWRCLCISKRPFKSQSSFWLCMADKLFFDSLQFIGFCLDLLLAEQIGSQNAIRQMRSRELLSAQTPFIVPVLLLNLSASMPRF